MIAGDTIRPVINAFAYCFKEARLATTGDSRIEHNRDVGQVSTIMRSLTSKDGDLLSHFDKINESEAELNNTSLEYLLVNNHDIAAKKGDINGQLPSEHFFGFCKIFRKLPNN